MSEPRTQAGRRLLRWPALQGGVYAIPEDDLLTAVLAVEAEARAQGAMPSVERLREAGDRLAREARALESFGDTASAILAALRDEP